MFKLRFFTNEHMMLWFKSAIIIFLIIFLTQDQVQSIVYKNFESANIGRVTQLASNHLNLALRDDNDDSTLPDDWRSWWYIKIMDEKNQDGKILIDISNRGWNYFTVPFYSYDNKTWHRVNEKTVTQSPECDKGIKDCILSFSQDLQNNTVYLASFIPYTFTDLEKYVDKISQHKAVVIETLGYSSFYQLPIQHLTITEPDSTEQIAQVWIQARTHPGETPGSFILEGLIDFLLSEDPVAATLREKLIFHIIPMHNPDGVIAGNYRSNPESTNFEVSWFFDKSKTSALTQEAPKENRLLNQVMQSLLSAKIPVKMALNFHASHSEPELEAFAFPHFGSNENKYTPQQIDLWNNQLLFMNDARNFYDKRIELPPQEGYSIFLNRDHPEKWWWYNTQNQVMALTFEGTYGKAGYDYWITDVEHRALGVSLAKAIAVYFHLDDQSEKK